MFSIKSFFKAKDKDLLDDEYLESNDRRNEIEEDSQNNESLKREHSLKAELVKDDNDEESYNLSVKIAYIYHNNSPLIGISDHRVIEGLFLLAAIKKDERFFKKMINEISTTVVTEKIYQIITKMGLALDDEKINEAFKRVSNKVGLEQVTIKNVANEFTNLTIADIIKDLDRAKTKKHNKTKINKNSSKDDISREIYRSNLLKTKPHLSEKDREDLVEKLHKSKDTIASMDQNSITSIKINYGSNQKQEGNSAQDIKNAIVDGLREGFGTKKASFKNDELDEDFKKGLVDDDEELEEDDQLKVSIPAKSIKNTELKQPKKIIPKEKSTTNDSFLKGLTSLEEKKIKDIKF